MSEGKLVEVDGRSALKFERRLPYPIERVWRAVTEYDELAAWFVAPMEFKTEGQQLEAMEQNGEVLRLEAPHVLEWDWGGERFSFELERDGDGTRLTFTHVFADEQRAPNYASGWEFHFGRLDAHLAGDPVPEADRETLLESSDRYSERFGVDPEVGRAIIAEHYGAAS